MYKHVIWDWNGTLINDTGMCAEIVNMCLERRGLKRIDIGVYKDNYELPVINFYKRIGFDCLEAEFATLSEEFLVIYEQRQFKCGLQEGAMEILNFFRSRDIKQSILSAYQQQRLVKAVEWFGIIDYFEHIFGRKDSLASGKIEIAHELIRNLNFNHDKILFIGDTIHDFEISQMINADCILVSRGHYSNERLQASEACVIESLKGLISV